VTGVELALYAMGVLMLGSVLWVRRYTKSVIVTALVVAAWIAAAYFAGLIV
jgi:hypothetical protein